MDDLTKSPQDIEDKVDQLLIGAIDPHVHSGPSIAERGIDHIEIAKEMSDAGFAAFVAKDHDYSGATCAWLIQKHHPELTTRMIGSIVLNNAVGGINPYAVEHMAALGGKVVWLPTLAAEHHIAWKKTANRVHPGASNKMREPVGVPVLNADKTVRDEVKAVLDVVAERQLVLASGHLHISETWIVFEEAMRRGADRLILTHPESIVDASMQDVRGLASQGVMVEHSLCLFIEDTKFTRFEGAELKPYIEAATPARTILSSDLGQKGAMSPVKAFRETVKLCLRLGYSEDEIKMMIGGNAGHLLGLNGITSS